jgi:uncharacterized membrane protein YhaH (DUF805 family)
MNHLDFFKLKPRLGRVRYLGLFSFWLSILLFVAFLFNGISSWYFLPELVSVILCVTAMVNMLLLKIRRLNDFNYRGWWGLMVVIPFLGLIWELMIFMIPGTATKNRFGNSVAKPSLFDFLLTLSAPVLFFLGVCFLSVIKS